MADAEIRSKLMRLLSSPGHNQSLHWHNLLLIKFNPTSLLLISINKYTEQTSVEFSNFRIFVTLLELMLFSVSLKQRSPADLRKPFSGILDPKTCQVQAIC